MEKSLYVHIPFCIRKCDYCDFFSIGCGVVPDEYVDAVINEASFLAKTHGIDSWKTIYIGGGTPSILSGKQMERLLKSLLSLSSKKPDEVTVEMNPETINAEKLDAAYSSGCTRLSVGIQSFTQSALDAVRRHCTVEKNISALGLLKSMWHGDLSLDLMAGLPCEPRKEFEASLSELVSYNPDHVSLYTLTIEEKAPLYGRIEEESVEFNPDDADAKWLYGRDFLESHGYRQYEVSNFAKPGKESIHNSSYWVLDDYVGCGAGASGAFYGKNGFRYTNSVDVDKYVSFWKKHDFFPDEIDLPRNVEILSSEVQEFEFLMMGLRTLKGVNSFEYEKRFADVKPWSGSLDSRLSPLENALTKIRETDGSVTYTLGRDNILFLNSFLLRLI